MLLYEVTLYLDAAIEQEWLGYMRDKHLAEVLVAGGFGGWRLWQVTSPEAEPGKVCYTVHYEVPSREALEAYLAGPAAGLRDDVQRHFGGRFRAERRVAVLCGEGQ